MPAIFGVHRNFAKIEQMLEAAEIKFYHKLVATALLTLGVGTTFYHFQENLSWIDAFYFSVVTLSTVGYGDITPVTSVGKIFTAFYILIGVGIITTFISYTLKRRHHYNPFDPDAKIPLPKSFKKKK